jgi:transcriptional regulator with XRE-family HTH domain
VEPRTQFGRNLRRLREAAEISQMELGDRCNMHFTSISRLERGERDPRLGTLVLLARGLKVPVSDLVAGIG